MINKTIIKVFALIIANLFSTNVDAEGFVVDNLHYKILSETDLTVSVTGLVSKSTQGGVFQMGVDFFGQSEETNTYSNITIPETVSYQSTSYKVVDIYNGAFKNQTDVQSVSIPSSVISIGIDAFYGTQLSSVVLPANLQTIGSCAFGNCSNLRDISCYAKKVPDMGLNASGNGPFYGTSISNCSLYVPFASLDDYKADEQWNKFGTIATIGSLSTIASGKCGDNLTWKLDGEFVLSINGKGEMNNYNSHEDVPWEEYSSQITSLQISEGVMNLGDHAFSGCSGLTSVVIPQYVTNIGNNAFSGCSKMTNVNYKGSIAQ